MKVQINSKFRESNTTIKVGRGVVAFTPPLDGDYWIFRVPLTDKQAIIGFPKFFTIGIGFQVEDYDWNTNLPFSCDAEEIYNHIKENKGDDSISDDVCIDAIKAIQKQAGIWKKSNNQ